jgi:hypothetical protein
MNTSWGTKSSHRRKRSILRTKVRWEVLGLQNPASSSSAPSIEDIRRQIISASSYGLSPDTLARTQTKGPARKPVPKVGESTRKPGARS